MRKNSGIYVDELTEKFSDYMDAYRYVSHLVEKGKLIPIQSSGTNGMRPPLYKRYRKPVVKKDYSNLEEDLRCSVLPPLSISHYLRHIAQYEKDRSMILALQDWLSSHPLPLEEVSMNERSFEIFHQEKILSQHGERLMRNLKIDPKRLAYYETCEPVSSFSPRRKAGPILIVENLDPFVTIRRMLMNGQQTICGMPVETVVYGAGKNIVRTFRDLLEFGTPEILDSLDQVYYWGDLDWEGLQIYDSLCTRWSNQIFHPFVPGYAAMLQRAQNIEQLPLMKEGQRENGSLCMLAYFEQNNPAYRKQLLDILEKRRYIPQEILNAHDYRAECIMDEIDESANRRNSYDD